MTEWRWCYRTGCVNRGLSVRNHCADCGDELAQAPTCDCGEAIAPKRVLYHLKQFQQKMFCQECGKEWSETFVGSKLNGEMLMAQFPGLVGVSHVN